MRRWRPMGCRSSIKMHNTTEKAIADALKKKLKRRWRAFWMPPSQKRQPAKKIGSTQPSSLKKKNWSKWGGMELKKRWPLANLKWKTINLTNLPQTIMAQNKHHTDQKQNHHTYIHTHGGRWVPWDARLNMDTSSCTKKTRHAQIQHQRPSCICQYSNSRNSRWQICRTCCLTSSGRLRRYSFADSRLPRNLSAFGKKIAFWSGRQGRTWAGWVDHWAEPDAPPHLEGSGGHIFPGTFQITKITKSLGKHICSTFSQIFLYFFIDNSEGNPTQEEEKNIHQPTLLGSISPPPRREKKNKHAGNYFDLYTREVKTFYVLRWEKTHHDPPTTGRGKSLTLNFWT